MASIRIRKVLNTFRASIDGIEPQLDRAQVAKVRKELRTAEILNLNCFDTSEVITEHGVEALARALKDAKETSHLRQLLLRGNQISDETFRFLARGIKTARLDSLEVLDLSENLIRTAGAKALGEALRFLPALHTLRIQSNPIGISGLNTLMDSLAQVLVPSLKELTIGDDLSLRDEICHSGGGALSQLTSVLKARSSEKLEILDVKHIGDAGVIHMMQAFQSPEIKFQLKGLFLERNNIGPEAVRHIADALECRALSCLSHLSLNGNESIGDVGVLILTKAFKSKNMDDLQHLSLSCISMGATGMDELAKILEQGYLPCLKHLNMDLNDTVTAEIADKFQQAFVKNVYLVVDLNLEWPTRDFQDRVNQQKRRNAKLATQLKILQRQQPVPAIHGKIYLCGEGGAGKTTLRKKLTMKWLRRKFPAESYPTKPEPTRGIEISHIGDNDVQLAVWDLAGQSEYQVLHSTFLPDLAFGDGQATLFVIVCRLNFTVEVDGVKISARKAKRGKEVRKELQYWLRFIASSSVKRVESLKRHVVIVLNSYGNDVEEKDQWKSELHNYCQKFQEFLDVHPHPFIIDVGKEPKVRPLKEHLQTKAKELLQGKTVPRICQEVREKARDLSKVQSREHFPVMNWEELQVKFLKEFRVNKLELCAAMEYLHEVGHVIYFKEGSLGESGFAVANQSCVVLDPEWFCKTVVGNLLLTKDMIERDEVCLRDTVQEDGFVHIADLRNCMPSLREEETAITLALLSRVGLVYRQGPEKVFMPALFKDDNLNKNKSYLSEWGSKTVAEQWVMGYSLLLKESEITILPVSILHRFQVQLALDKDLTDYSAGLLHVLFKMDCMFVLVQFSEDGRPPKSGHSNDTVGIRIDIMVKPLVSKDGDDLSSDLRRVQQVNLAQMVVEKLELISEVCCPGVQFVKKVIKPWAAEGRKSMEKRDVRFSVDDVKRCVQEVGLDQVFQNWQVENSFVRATDLLCQSDLTVIYLATERKNQLIVETLEQLGVQTPTISMKGGPSELARLPAERNESTSISAGESSRFFDKIVFHVGRKLDAMEQRSNARFDGLHEHLTHVDRHLTSGMHDLYRELRASLHRQKLLISNVQTLATFTVSERSSNVPLYVYLMKNDPNDREGWKLRKIIEKLRTTVEEKFYDTVKLRFLCEAYYKDDSLHEVDMQEGVDLKDQKLWLTKLTPCLVWSLKIAFVAAKVGTNLALPGLGSLFPSDQALSSARSFLEGVDLRAQQVRSLLESIKNSIELSDSATGRSREELKMLLRTLNPSDREKKVALTRVALKSSRDGYDRVVWICKPCLREYRKKSQVKELDWTF